MEEENNKPYLTPESIEILDHLFSAVPPEELRENLLEVYHTYLILMKGDVPGNVESIARSMYHLIHCLAEVKRSEE